MVCCSVKNQVLLKCRYRNISDQLLKGRQKPGDFQAEKPLDPRPWQCPLGEDTPSPCQLQLLPSTLEERAVDKEDGNLPMAKMIQEGRSLPPSSSVRSHTCACTYTCSHLGHWVHCAVLHCAVLNNVGLVGFD